MTEATLKAAALEFGKAMAKLTPPTPGFERPVERDDWRPCLETAERLMAAARAYHAEEGERG